MKSSGRYNERSGDPGWSGAGAADLPLLPCQYRHQVGEQSHHQDAHLGRHYVSVSVSNLQLVLLLGPAILLRWRHFDPKWDILYLSAPMRSGSGYAEHIHARSIQQFFKHLQLPTDHNVLLQFGFTLFWLSERMFAMHQPNRLT